MMKKDIKWAKNRIKNNLKFEAMNEREIGFKIAMKKALEIINQLDETEVVYVDELENLIIPKQELPVMPKYVAEYLDYVKERFSLIQVLEMASRPDELPKFKKENVWISSNDETFARAWLDGFMVEEEPLYRARLKVITDKFIASYLRTQFSGNENRLKELEIGNKYIHENYRHLSEFTENELKKLGIWDSDQWIIEEVEE